MGAVSKSTKELRGYVLVIIAAILWGTMGILAKLSFEHGISPETLIALRLVISFATLSVALGLFSRASFKTRKSDMLLFLVLGLFGIAFQRVAYFYAVGLTTATVAAILFYTYPVFVTLSAVLFWKEKLTLGAVVAIILTFSGVALVVRIYDVASLNASFFGIIFGLFSSLLFVLYFMLVKKLRNKYTSWTLTLYGEGVGMLTLIPVVYASFPSITEFSMQLWLLIFTIAWIPSLLAYLLYSHALKYVDASKGSILGVIEPLSAAMLSAALLRESLELLQMIGIVLSLIGVVLLFSKGRRRND
jgi:drug/metabolite transporter (DMT)-like permease